MSLGPYVTCCNSFVHSYLRNVVDKKSDYALASQVNATIVIEQHHTPFERYSITYSKARTDPDRVLCQFLILPEAKCVYRCNKEKILF